MERKKKVKILLIYFIISLFLIPPILNVSNLLDNRKKNCEQTSNQQSLFLHSSSKPEFFTYYKEITIDHAKVSGSSNLINFPLLISIIDSGLHDDVQPDGDDIAFAIDDIWLDHEIELFNPTYSSTHAKLVAWVRIPSLSPFTDTIIKMYYGNSTMTSQENPLGVWDNSYRGVWHLGESNGDALDSTSYETNGTLVNGVLQGVYGQIGTAYDFDGINDYVIMGDPADGHLDFGNGSFTFSAWVDVEQNTSYYQRPLWKGTSYSQSGYCIDLSPYLEAMVKVSDGTQSAVGYSSNAFNYNEWVLITGVVDRSSNLIILYINGVKIGTGTDISSIGSVDTTDPLRICGDNLVDGMIDEVRISNTTISAAWIATEYNNQYDPNGFYSISTRIELHPPKPDFFNFYKIITINYEKVSGTTDLVDFPLLISLEDPDLKDKVQFDGDDIRFSNGTDFSNGAIWLDHEIELFEQNYHPNYGKLVVWVRLPILYHNKDTKIYMYYGNSTMKSQQYPSGVWDSNYKGVWHLSESSGNALDSTSYGTDGTTVNGVIQGVSGQIGAAYDFDGINDYVIMGDPADGHLDFGTGSFTVSVWVIIDQDTGYYQSPLWKGGSYTPIGYCIECSPLREASLKVNDGSQAVLGYAWNAFNYDEWVFITGVVDRSSNLVILYINGVKIGTGTDISSIGSLDTTDPLRISGDPPQCDLVDGMIDEVRISNTAFSTDWIATEYNNQYDPNGFYSISTRIELHPPKPDFFNFYKIITINHEKVNGTSNLIDFPLLVSLEDPDLKDQVQSDGDDIRFSNGTDFSNGAIWLDHEIELFEQNYNPSYGKLVAWIRVPILYYNKDTKIYMYYGNSTMKSQEYSLGVWDSNYKGVWHLAEDPSGTSPQMIDSTQNGNYGTSCGGLVSGDLVTGQIGKGVLFEASKSQYINCLADTSLNMGQSDITLEVWFSTTTNDATRRIVGKGSTSIGGKRYLLEIDYDSGGKIKAEVDDDIDNAWSVFSPSEYQYWDGEFHQAVLIKDGANFLHIYIDGMSNTSWDSGYGNIDSDYPFLIASMIDNPSGNPASFFNGIIDEVRVSNTARSSNWIVTQYNNHDDPDSFYSISARIHVRRPKPESFQSLKTIIIDHTKVSGSSDLINFPLLISVYDEDLHDDVQPDGDDIAFWNGTVWLDHEIELFDQTFNSTHAQLVTWVRIPKLYHNKNTIIYMHYGNSTLCSQENPSGVWDSSYVGVWHLLESNGDAIDSTIYSEHGTISGTINQGSVGKINSAYNFGTAGTVNVGDPSDEHLDFDESIDFTISFWLNIDTTTTVKQRPLYKGGSSLSDGGYSFETSISGDLINFYICDETSRVGSYSAPITYDQWTYITGVVDRTNDYIYIYKDNSIITGGVSISSVSGSLNNDIDLQFPWATSDLDGLMDEIRISNLRRSADWIATEYNSQHDPKSFFSIGPETEVGESSVEVHVVDLYGNFIPNLSITMTNNSIIYGNAIANDAGIATFGNISKLSYNFIVEMTSDIGVHSVIVNKTTHSILVDEPVEIIYLVCNVSTNFFDIRDTDGVPIASGWIIVGNSSHNLQNCTIEENGHSRFWWVNTTPYNYNYTVYYRDEDYHPNTVSVASGDITKVNSTILVTTRLSTVNFTVITEDSEPIGGAKLILNYTHTLENAVNLTTDAEGKTTFRWLNTTNSYNYSLKITFVGKRWNFDISGVTPGFVSEFDLCISSSIAYDIVIKITQSEIEEYETAIVSLNPMLTISIEWGSTLALRTLFNVTKIPSGASIPLGPTSADSILYKIYLFGSTTPLKTSSMVIDAGYEGTYRCVIDTEELECKLYSIKISAYKSGYVIPEDLIITLNVLKNELYLNQSENDDSPQNIYWLENVNMSVKPYGEIIESFTLQDSQSQSNNQAFSIIIHDISNSWNLSTIALNIQEISWTATEPNTYIRIIDPYFNTWIFDPSNFTYYDYDMGICTITLNYNKTSSMYDNIFRFNITGSFNSPIDITAESCFIRDKLEVQYSQFNIKDEISIINEAEGWAIKNITFNISNFYNVSSGQLIDPATAIEYITTIEGFKYTLDSSELGKGTLSISNITIYPFDNQFSFGVHSNIDIIFDVVINVEYIQYFYQNKYLESFNSSTTVRNFDNSLRIFQVSAIENDWIEYKSELIIMNIYDGIKYVTPSDVAMNITIGGQFYAIIETVEGEGIVSIEGLEKDIIHTIIIQANKQVNFSFIYKISYTRTSIYETRSIVNFFIREAPDIFGTVEYYKDLNCYLKEIDTSLIDADNYTVRFTATKDHYFECLKDLKLNVMSRLTLINGTSDYFREIKNIYIGDAVNFKFEFTDALTGEKIVNLTTCYFVWEQYSGDGSVISSGKGSLNSTIYNLYILDFDTETRPIGNYMLIITLDKDNYDYKNAMIFLTINIRFLEYSLSDNFYNFQTKIVQGKAVQIRLNLTDPTQGGIPLLNAIINLTINGNDYNFEELGNGTYILNFHTDNVNSFFSSKTLAGIINITKENYLSEAFNIIIVVEMEEIFPGMPTFYFLIIVFGILAVVGSITAYKVYKHVTIPTFVKNVRQMQKEIKGGKQISESLLYQRKEAFIGELVRDKWSSIGLSLGDILRIEIKKSRKLHKIKPIKSEKVHDLKPLGLILMRWNERIGVELLAKYPQHTDVSDKSLMQIYGTHEYSGEKGLITLISGNLNLLSYYTGPETGYYIVLILSIDDDSDIYEGAIANVAQIILQNLEDDVYLQMIPSFFQRLSIYPNLTEEQNLIFFYQDNIKRMIINILRNYGVISKSELIIWMKDRELEGIIDMEAILADLIKNELIKVASVKGIPSELIFLTKDIFMLRVPPNKLFEDPVNHGLPTQFEELYQYEVEKFFNEYHPTEEDTLKLLDSLVDIEVYETLRLLRTAIVTMKDFEKLKSKGVSDIYGVLKKLWDINMIKTFKDENGVEYYGLIADFYINLIFPKYLLNDIKLSYDQKSKTDKVLLDYLRILEDTYTNLKSKK